VTLKPGATARPTELRAFAREQMAPYKDPRYVWLVPGLPKGPAGEILRREVQPPEELR
jgi:long-chain acyl-CoA synthetase